MRRAEVAILVLAASLIAGGCAKKKKPVPVPRTSPQPAATPRQGETGIASWYGNPYHGRVTASGEIYDMDKVSAAHRTLPFQTRVRVHNLDNGKTLEVRINDRGPFIGGRIIDLSRAAAGAIGMIGPGLARVRLEILSPQGASLEPLSAYAVQVGAFRDRSNADRLRARMERRYGSAKIVRSDRGSAWRVLVGSEPSLARAEALAARIEAGGAKEAFAVRLDP
ncbi:MAG: septal ring lytic transglycosylase RlpA family protein [Bryobacterales bacterium]|nr:septal ring lytic transglycosylase RlpA family protein [Bryobacterales bacterium]